MTPTLPPARIAPCTLTIHRIEPGMAAYGAALGYAVQARIGGLGGGCFADVYWVVTGLASRADALRAAEEYAAQYRSIGGKAREIL